MAVRKNNTPFGLVLFLVVTGVLLGLLYVASAIKARKKSDAVMEAFERADHQIDSSSHATEEKNDSIMRAMQQAGDSTAGK